MPGSLAEMYFSLVNADQAQVEKHAAEVAATQPPAIDEDAMKTAAEYDMAGRMLAHAHFDQFIQEKLAEAGEEAAAMPFAGKETPAEEKAEEKAKKKDEKKEEKSEKSDEEKLEEKKASIARRLLEDPEYQNTMVRRYLGR